MAAPSLRQWICHSPNIMKTEMLLIRNGSESGKTTQGSIRFDAPRDGFSS
jgi:hypothetical protein